MYEYGVNQVVVVGSLELLESIPYGGSGARPGRFNEVQAEAWNGICPIQGA